MKLKNFLVVQWLSLCASSAGGEVGLILSRNLDPICHTVRPKEKKNEIFMVKGRHDIEQSFEKDFWSRVSLAYSKDIEKKPRRRQD